MCLGSPTTWTLTPVGMSTSPAGSFCLCCFWQAVRRMWSLHVSEIPRHTDLHPVRNIYLTSRFILSVLLLTGGDTSVVPTCVGVLLSLDLHPSRNLHLTSWFILSVLLFRGNQMSVVPTHVQDPHHTDLHPGRNVFLTSWFILSVLFLTGGETSVVPTYVQDPASHGPPPW